MCIFHYAYVYTEVGAVLERTIRNIIVTRDFARFSAFESAKRSRPKTNRRFTNDSDSVWGPYDK